MAKNENEEKKKKLSIQDILHDIAKPLVFIGGISAIIINNITSVLLFVPLFRPILILIAYCWEKTLGTSWANYQNIQEHITSTTCKQCNNRCMPARVQHNVSWWECDHCGALRLSPPSLFQPPPFEKMIRARLVKKQLKRENQITV